MKHTIHFHARGPQDLSRREESLRRARFYVVPESVRSLPVGQTGHLFGLAVHFRRPWLLAALDGLRFGLHTTLAVLRSEPALPKPGKLLALNDRRDRAA